MSLDGQYIDQHKHTQAILLLNIHHPRAKNAFPRAGALHVVMPGLAVLFVSPLLK